MIESKLQSKAIKWLKESGAYVIKTRPGAGTPTGCPDVFFFYKEKWGAIEFKSGPKARFQPLQEYTLDLLGGFNRWVYVAHPDNWDEIKLTLEKTFF